MEFRVYENIQNLKMNNARALKYAKHVAERINIRAANFNINKVEAEYDEQCNCIRSCFFIGRENEQMFELNIFNHDVVNIHKVIIDIRKSCNIPEPINHGEIFDVIDHDTYTEEVYEDGYIVKKEKRA